MKNSESKSEAELIKENEVLHEKLKVLEKTKEQFRIIAENANDNISIVSFDIKAKYLYVSPSVKHVLDYDPKDLLGKSFFDFIHPDDKKILLLLLKKYIHLKIGKVFRKDNPKMTTTIEFRFIDKAGIWHNMQSTVNYIGKNLLSITRDITEHKRIEQALRESEKKYKDLFEKSADAILVIQNGKFVDCNQATIKMLRYNNKDEFLMTHPSELSPEKQQDGKLSFAKANEMMKIAFKNGSHRFEWYHKKSDGEIFPVEVLLTAISIDEKDQVLHAIWCDITERKQMEQALQENKTRYKNLFSMVRLMSDNLPDLIWAKDIEGKFLFVNKACCEILLNAKDTDEPIGKTDLYFAQRGKDSHPDNPDYFTFGELCADSDLAVLDTKKPLRFDESGNVNGKFLFLDVYKAPFTDENGIILGTVGSARIVTKERQMEKEFRKKEKKYREKLEEQVRERTNELEKKNKNLEKFNTLFVGREFRIKELRNKVKELEEKNK